MEFLLPGRFTVIATFAHSKSEAHTHAYTHTDTYILFSFAFILLQPNPNDSYWCSRKTFFFSFYSHWRAAYANNKANRSIDNGNKSVRFCYFKRRSTDHSFSWRTLSFEFHLILVQMFPFNTLREDEDNKLRECHSESIYFRDPAIVPLGHSIATVIQWWNYYRLTTIRIQWIYFNRFDAPIKIRIKSIYWIIIPLKTRIRTQSPTMHMHMLIHIHVKYVEVHESN